MLLLSDTLNRQENLTDQLLSNEFPSYTHISLPVRLLMLAKPQII